ncbi:hypothetical protein [Luteimonas salinilitoris]|uniref:hypothetical protein n=1 Tax=Luteimonas salinilitoris TaxID=3237697 RepID=UPI00351C9DE2
MLKLPMGCPKIWKEAQDTAAVLPDAVALAMNARAAGNVATERPEPAVAGQVRLW